MGKRGPQPSDEADVVDRVAIAIVAAWGVPPPGWWDALSEEGKENARKMARAAIEAMKKESPD